MNEYENALKADNALALRLLSQRQGLSLPEFLDKLFTATALVYAEATEPRRSELFKALLTLMEFLQDERLAIATSERFKRLS